MTGSSTSPAWSRVFIQMFNRQKSKVQQPSKLAPAFGFCRRIRSWPQQTFADHFLKVFIYFINKLYVFIVYCFPSITSIMLFYKETSYTFILLVGIIMPVKKKIANKTNHSHYFYYKTSFSYFLELLFFIPWQYFAERLQRIYYLALAIFFWSLISLIQRAGSILFDEMF